MLDINSPAMKATLERLGTSLTELNQKETQVDMSQPLNLGEFGTQPNAYSVMLVVNFKAQTSDGEVSTLLAGTMSCIRVKQRLIFVYTYRKYESKADVETLRDFTRQWIGQILAAN